MIIGEIRRYLRDNNAIRVSRSLRDIAYKALKARDRLAERMGREPNVTELCRGTEAAPRGTVVLCPGGDSGPRSASLSPSITTAATPSTSWIR